MSVPRAVAKDDYTVGWVCALPCEMAAAKGMLDEIHQDLQEQDTLDHNSYILGEIHYHNVVVACLPAGIYGLSPAATVAKDMLRTFRSIRFGLMVGIGGAAPSLAHDIRLGDVVVSQPSGSNGGVIQYDRGKTIQSGGFQRTGTLNSPPLLLPNALSRLQAEHEGSFSKIPLYLSKMVKQYPKMEKDYAYQGVSNDFLYEAEYEHLGPILTCEHCDRSREVPREPRDGTEIHIHYGNIASGNQVIKHGITRERLRKELDVLCFEMEAAGLMLDFPCLVIRGICDYSDSHKNKNWQKYAAATAAAFAKELLSVVSTERVRQAKSIVQVSDPVLREIVSSIGTCITRQTQKQETQYKNDTQHQCHQVFKTSIYEQFKNINPDRALNTCTWVLSHPQYIEWLHRPKDDLLWISADPGCGKSVLSKSLIDHEFHNTNINTVCYFFFKDNKDQNSIATALCALLHQLFASQFQLLRHATSAWEKNGDKLQSEVGELWRILLAAATDPTAGNVLCVLDALDECQPQDRRVLIQNLLNFYAASSRIRPYGTLKFLVTSRPYDDIELGFKEIPPSLPAIRLSGEMENDKIREEIDLVIRERVEKLTQDNQLSPKTKQNLEQRLLAMEHRTYLWLHLAIESIQDLYRNSLQPDTESIESLPSSVEDAYEKILRKVNAKHQKTVNTLLHMIIGARRPLTVAEMAIALGIHYCPNATALEDVTVDQDRLERRIRHLCGLFVFINHSRIYLIHQTAREFLLKRDGIHEDRSGWRHCLDPIESENIMACVCVQYLLLYRSQEDHQEPSDWPSIHHDSTYEMVKENTTTDRKKAKPTNLQMFLEYSAKHWPRHFRNAHLDVKNLLMTKAYQLYWAGSEIYVLWFNILWKALCPYDRSPTLDNIEVAAFNGHEGVLELLLETEQRNRNRDQRCSKALYWAAEQGHEAAAKLLMERGANANAQGGSLRNALYAASKGGHERVVELLLSQGAEVNAQGGEYGNALCAASQGGYVKVIELLLSQGAEVNAQVGHYGDALCAASEGGHEKVVELLLSRGAEVNTQGGQHGNALCAASRKGHKKVIELLLSQGAEVNAQGGHYGNALCATSGEGHEKIAELLLSQGAEVNAQGGYYGNALCVASMEGHKKVVELLLSRGAEVNAQGGKYGNALCAASRKGHEKIIELLLSQGAKINAQVKGYYGNALCAASEGCHVNAVELLLSRGAEVNAQGGYYGNALCAASGKGPAKVIEQLFSQAAEVNTQSGHYSNALCAEKVVELLLSQGAEVNARVEGYYGSVLCAASEGGYEKVVELLLSRGAEVNTQGGQYGNALCAASRKGHKKVVELLLNQGAEVNAQGGKYSNALCAASEGGHEKVVELLLSRGAEVNTQGGYYDNALYATSRKGHKKAVELLLSQGAEVNAQGGQYGNALCAASRKGHKKVVELLLSQGAEVNAQVEGDYGNALCAASQGGHVNVVELLLSRGAEVNAQGGPHGNALCAASGEDHKKVVELLLNQGAEVNAQVEGYHGNALYAASEEGHVKIVKLLISRGAEVSARGGYYGNALCVASAEGREKVVELLLSRGAEVNTQCGRYGNALCAASERGHKKVAKLLLSRGAPICTVTH